MASKQTYTCFKCRDAGADNVQVYLDGKDPSGKTKYLNPDMSEHFHKQKEGRTSTSTTTSNSNKPSLADIYERLATLERKIDLLTKVVFAISGTGKKPEDVNQEAATTTTT